ncbi:MAG: TIGR01777 family oxidoreductase [Patescibacteria group bacterium]|nr:TIGR01777 family oxidoreductase [Patescibacteria group bacterium]
MTFNPLRILVSGSSGLIGSSLVPFLTSQGHTVLRLVRSKSMEDNSSLYWDPIHEIINLSEFEGLDAVVHLAGENIAGGKWTDIQKKRIYESRIKGTRFLCKSLARLTNPPGVLLCASAIGYYGNRGDEILDENSVRGTGFLSDVCHAWEMATEPAIQKGIRTVNLRFGIILSSSGGTLAKMLLPFKMGLGGVLGSGRQFMSWISITDVINSIHYSILNTAIKGPVNIVAPYPLTNREFTKILGSVLNRPTLFSIPAFILRFVFGEMADELMLTSQRIVPAKLKTTGYTFQYPELEGALKHLLRR